MLIRNKGLANSALVNRASLTQPHQQVLALDVVADLDADLLDGAGGGGADGGEHFHGFESDEGFAFFDLLADGDSNAGDHAGHGGADLHWISRVGFDFTDGVHGE